MVIIIAFDYFLVNFSSQMVSEFWNTFYQGENRSPSLGSYFGQAWARWSSAFLLISWNCSPPLQLSILGNFSPELALFETNFCLNRNRKRLMRSSICFELPPWREAQKFIFYPLDSLFDYSTLPYLVERSLIWQECQLKEFLKVTLLLAKKSLTIFEKLARWSCWGPKAWFCERSSRKRKFEKWVGLRKFLWNFGWVLKFPLKFWVGLEIHF